MSISLQVKLTEGGKSKVFLKTLRAKTSELLELQRLPLFQIFAYSEGVISHEVLLNESFSNKFGYLIFWLKKSIHICSGVSLKEIEDLEENNIISALSITIFELKPSPVLIPEDIGFYMSFTPFPREDIDMVCAACSAWAVAKPLKELVWDGGSNWVNEEYMDPDQFIEKFSKTEVMKRCMIERKWEK